MSKQSDAFIGTKFFKYNDDDTLETIRVIKAKSKNVFLVRKDNDDGKTYIRTSKDLHNYTILRPNTLFNFSIVVNAEEKDSILYDIIVTMHRKKKDDTNGPYVVCRQMMQNIFVGLVSNQKILGSCVNQDTCPPGLDFKVNLMCSRLVEHLPVNGYLDDTPETILALAKPIVEKANQFLRLQRKILEGTWDGLCSTVHQLLQTNQFWEDVDKGLNIIRLNDKIENYSINLEQLTWLEQEISYIMDDIHVIEYGPDIEFDKIQSDYILIRDNVKKVYLISYLRGNFIKQEHMSEEEVMKFTSIKI